MNILLIEDDVIWQVKLQQMIEELEHVVIDICINVAEAIQKIEEKKPDIIVSDIMLGNSLIFEVFENENLKSLPFIFITLSESDIHYEVSKAAPNSFYLVKPFHKISLAAAIDKLSINLKQNERSFGIQVKGAQNERYFLKTEQIVFVKAELNYCIIKTPNNQFAIKKSLVNIINELGPQMLQIHRSIIVNKEKIIKLQITKAEVQTEIAVLPIGRQYRQKVLDYIAQTTKI